jgi:hypothetical protein
MFLLMVVGYFAFQTFYDPTRAKPLGARGGGGTVTDTMTPPPDDTTTPPPDDTTTPPPDDTSTGGETSEEGSGSPVPLSITVNSLSSITIKSDTLTSSTGFFKFGLYQDQNLQLSLDRGANFAFRVSVIVREYELRRDPGFVWNNISPQFQYSTKYWMSIEQSYPTGQRIYSSPIPRIDFTTFGPQTSSSDPTLNDKIEEFCRELADTVLLPMAVEEVFVELLHLLYKLYKGRNAALPAIKQMFGMFGTLSDKIDNYMKTEPLKRANQARIKALSAASARFATFISLFDFDKWDIEKAASKIESIGKIYGTLKLTMGRLIDYIKDVDFNDVYAAVKGSLKAGWSAAKTVAMKIGTAVLTAGRFAAGMLVPDPLDIALMAISLTGAMLEQENKGGMLDWNQLKTSDFLSYQEDSIREQHESWLKELKITAFPLINGPLNKYDEPTLMDEVEKLTKSLIFLPCLRSAPVENPINTDIYSPLDYYKFTMDVLSKRALAALSPSGIIRTQTDLDTIENLQVMQDLRYVQVECFRKFKDYVLSVPLTIRNTPYVVSQNKYGTTALEQYSLWFISQSDLLDKMNRVCIYIFCKMNGGKPLRNGQCSYSTPSDCFNSYPWPLPQPAVFNTGYIEARTRVCSPKPGTPCPSPSPCPVSPCLELNSDLGETDHIYSEWRHWRDLQREFSRYDLDGHSPLWTDPAVVNGGGACVIYNPNVRQMCEASTKLDDLTGDGVLGGRKIIARNNYNMYTGECTNTREFCTAYGVSYRSDMPKSEMANRGSGSLPSCYWSDAQKAGSMILGSDIVIQYMERAGTALRNGWRTFAGLFNGRDLDAEADAARRAEIARLAGVAAIVEAQTDEAQIAIFNNYYNMKYIYSNTLQCVDMKIDAEGNIYVLYAYDTDDGLLTLVKFNSIFKEKWKMSTGFSGPVENFLQSQLALDSDGYVYFMMSNYDVGANKYLRYIHKFNKDGTEITVNWPIKPDSVTNADGIFPSATNIKGYEFNGIFIRSNLLYVSWVGYRVQSDGKTIDRNLQKLIRYNNITGVRNNGTSIMNSDTYVTDGISAAEISEEIFSFVVDTYGNQYSFYRNNYGTRDGSTSVRHRGILTKYTATTGVRRDIDLSSFVSWNGPSSINPNINDYPSMCIESSSPSEDEIFISNGINIMKIIEPYSTPIVSLYTLDLQNYEFNTIGDSFKDPDFKPWDCSMMTLDPKNNLSMFIEKTKYIKVGNIKKIMTSTTSVSQYQNIIHYRLDPPIPLSVTKGLLRPPTNVRVFVDYVLFEGFEFDSNCFGHESVTLVVDPMPSKVDATTFKDIDMVGRVIDIKRQTPNVMLPQSANKVIFQPGIDYTISLKINDDIVYTHPTTLQVDTSLLTESKIDVMSYVGEIDYNLGIFHNVSLIQPRFGSRIIQFEHIGTGAVTNALLENVSNRLPSGNIRIKIPDSCTSYYNAGPAASPPNSVSIIKLKIRYPPPYDIYPILRCTITFNENLIKSSTGSIEFKNRNINITYPNTGFSSDFYTSQNVSVFSDSANIYPYFFKRTSNFSCNAIMQ